MRSGHTAGSSRQLAWGLLGLSVALFVVGITLSVGSTGGRVDQQDVISLTFVAVFSALGLMIASRQPRNAIGWIFLGVAVSAGLGHLARGYVEQWLAGGAASRAVGELAAVYAESSWIPWVLIPTTFLLLLFPDGRLPSARWRIIAWCAGLGIAGEFAAGIFLPGPLEDFPAVVNPYAVDLPAVLEAAPALLCVVGILGSAMSVIVRFRRGSATRRQQIKWLAYAAALAGPTVIAGIVAYDALGPFVAGAVIQGAVLCLPVAAGVAILRYRLFDIDIVVNRTLVYGALTATLAGAYFGSVLLLGLVLNPLTDQSNLAVAGSTLAVAALFRPARDRIQRWVDRRFYRRRYDAVRTLTAFSGRLRDELDLSALSGDLCEVARETMQPTHVSVWLAPSEVRS